MTPLESIFRTSPVTQSASAAGASRTGVWSAFERLVGRLPIRWHVLLLPLFFIPIISYWVIGERYITEPRTFVLGTLLNFSMSACCVLLLDYLTQRVIRRYPELEQSAPRILRTFGVFLLVTPLFLLTGIFIYSHFHLFGYQHDPDATGRILLFNIGANLLSVGIDETVYSLNKWRENALEREELKKVNLQSQYESLKHQVNPHFLFNSLNSLSSLIADEPEQAEQFVDEMAKVYRYLLQANGRPGGASGADDTGELTPLATELKFIDSYYHLLKTRYRAGIDLRTDIPAEYLTYRLPPLTLQMLVENAVKHNVISANRPLLLQISAMPDPNATGEDGPVPVQLVVRNNLQRKMGRVASNQVGLANIAAKYRLLSRTAPELIRPVQTGSGEPVVRDDDGYFTVILPLFLP